MGRHSSSKLCSGTRLDPVLSAISMSNAGIRSAVDALHKANPQMTRAAAIEQALAALGARVPQPVLQRLAEGVQRIQGRTGTGAALTEAEAREMVVRALAAGKAGAHGSSNYHAGGPPPARDGDRRRLMNRTKALRGLFLWLLGAR